MLEKLNYVHEQAMLDDSGCLLCAVRVFRLLPVLLDEAMLRMM